MLGNPPNWLERAEKFHCPLTSVGDVENQDIRKVNTVKLWKQSAEAVKQNGTTRRCVWRSQSNLVGVPGTSTNSDPDYFNEHGEPVCAHALMVHTKAIHKKKHLIQFLMSVNLEKVRKPAEGPCPTVLLKADTGADVNLLNLTTFDKIIDDRSILQPSTLRMEAYGNSTVALLGKFHVFMRWKGRIYRQLFFVTTAHALPNLLSRDSCYTLAVLKPCYSVETLGTSSRFQRKLQAKATPLKTDLNQSKMHGISSHHLGNEGTEEEKLSCLIPLSGLSTRSNFKVHAIEEAGHP